MTGGSSEVKIILDAEFFGQQWLIGSYQGSNEYATRILYTYKGTNKLREAWILIAPVGARKLDLKILNNVGLNFPSGYEKIGVVTSAHRNETQELWKPKI